MEIPPKVPKPGFYYHYKHDPNGSVENYAYEFVGVVFHTEPVEKPEDGWFANYRPLYESAAVYQASLTLGVPCADARPLLMWMEDVTKDGKTFPRFAPITDEAILSKLREIREKMYEK